LVGGIDVEAFGNAVGGDLDRVGVFRLQSAILERRLEVVDDGQRKALLAIGGSSLKRR
jgi:hypothetical protein